MYRTVAITVFHHNYVRHFTAGDSCFRDAELLNHRQGWLLLGHDDSTRIDEAKQTIQYHFQLCIMLLAPDIYVQSFYYWWIRGNMLQKFGKWFTYFSIWDHTSTCLARVLGILHFTDTLCSPAFIDQLGAFKYYFYSMIIFRKNTYLNYDWIAREILEWTNH